MIYTVQQFCQYVEQDLNGFISEIEDQTNRNMSFQEKQNLSESYIQVSAMLGMATRHNPQIGQAHITTSDLLLEYRLPAASAWCDLVLLGKGKGRNQVIVVELKNWMKNSSDKPGLKEGLIEHQGVQHLHPSDQVKGYTEYCRRFHSVVQNEHAEVNGCVYFTKDIDTKVYKEFPNEALTKEYPVYNTKDVKELSDYVAHTIEEGDKDFATRFVHGYYQQDRNILRQVAENFSRSSDAKPFVLLDAQRRGFELVMSTLDRHIRDERKEVIIVEGPPGSGKSAVAVNLWFEAVLRYVQHHVEMKHNIGNIVYVTTSSSQKDNWMTTFKNYGGRYGAENLIVTANSFNPGMSGLKMKSVYLPIFRKIDAEKYVSESNANSLKYDYFEDYTNYMVEHNMSTNYKDNLHFLSIVDEAHALINPLADNFCTNKTAGWCFQMGPQVYHIIRESQISVFFTDGKQSFRDNETTRVEDIEYYAKKLGAEVTKISLAGMQFRCAGAVEYVDWVEHLFDKEALDNVNLWKDKFHVEVVDYPSDVDAKLRAQIERGMSCRILSTYTKKWVSKADLNEQHTQEEQVYDFILDDKDGTYYKKYWNNPAGYEIFVQADGCCKMSRDPLCEVGCPYVVRGFDYDYIGLLWLDDIVRRGDKWWIDINNVEETAIGSTKKDARDEQLRRKKDLRQLIDADNPRTPYTQKLFETIKQAYRIVMTRGIKGMYIYIQDDRTRNYVRGLLNK